MRGVGADAAEGVDGDDEVALGVDGLARPDHRVPPADLLVARVIAARRVRVAGEEVADEHGVVARRVEAAVGLEAHRDLAQALTASELQLGDGGDLLGGQQGGRFQGGFGHRASPVG
ncbi:hypothetical protein D3C87_1849410 [compost metagenome]